MLRRFVLPLALVVGVAALAYLLLQAGVDTDPSRSLSRDGGEADTGARDPLAGEATGAGQRGEPRHSPRLFGRPREERVGLGGLRGRILQADDHAPVVGAKLSLEGTGNGGEAVLRRLVSGEDGAFTIPDVPAGDDYVLTVLPNGAPGRVRGSVAVQDGALTDLGTLWIGERAALGGIVLDAQAGRISGALVRVHEGHFTFGALLQDPAKLFESLDAEPVTLVASFPGQASAFLAAVVVADGGTKAPWTLTLAPGTRVAGTVVDERGRGIYGACVAVIPGKDQRRLSTGGPSRKPGATAASGSTTHPAWGTCGSW
ncbi:MAG: carboxypeptidase regulatory-like domain-containing protein [Acidobacteriota bacterium]